MRRKASLLRLGLTVFLFGALLSYLAVSRAGDHAHWSAWLLGVMPAAVGAWLFFRVYRMSRRPPGPARPPAERAPRRRR